MAVDAFLSFAKPATGPTLIGETTDSFFSKQQAFEIKEFSFGEENATTIGSSHRPAASAPAKAKINPFKIKKPVDSASPNFFLASSSVPLPDGHHLRPQSRRRGRQVQAARRT